MRLAVSALALGALGSGALQAATLLDYWMWDNNQKPGYQMCEHELQSKRADIQIKIGVAGWNVATPEHALPYPMTDRGSEIRSIMRSAVQEALGDEESDVAAILTDANRKVNTLLK